MSTRPHPPTHTHTGFRRLLLSSVLAAFQKGTPTQSLLGVSIALSSVALFVHCRQYPTYQLNLTGELCQWVTAIVFLYALVDRLDVSKTFVTGRDEWIFDFVLTGMFPVAILVLGLLLIRRYLRCVYDLCCGCCKITSRQSNWERYANSPHVAELDIEAQGAEEQSRRPAPRQGGLRSLLKSDPTPVVRQKGSASEPEMDEFVEVEDISIEVI